MIYCISDFFSVAAAVIFPQRLPCREGQHLQEINKTHLNNVTSRDKKFYQQQADQNIEVPKNIHNKRLGVMTFVDIRSTAKKDLELNFITLMNP